MTPQLPMNPSTELLENVPAAAVRPFFQHSLYWLAAGITLVSGTLIALALTYLHTQAVESGKNLTESFVQIIEEQTTRTIQTVDQLLQLGASGMAQLDASGSLNEASARELLRAHLKELPFVRSIWVMDSQGRVQYDSDIGYIGVNLADRAYFQIYRTQPQTGFYLGSPVLSRSTGKWLISASRPLHTSNGGFSGTIVAAVDPTYFDKLWRSVDVGDGGSIALFRRNGVLMMRSPFDDAAMGKEFSRGPIFSQMLLKSPVGTLQFSSAIDGKLRTYSYRTLTAQPELVVVVGQSIELALAPWRQLTVMVISVWSAASAAVITFCVFLGRAWRQKEKGETIARQMAQRLILATDAASIAVWDWDISKADQWFATPTYFTALGYEPHEGFANRAQWLERLHPDDRGAVEEKIQAVLAGGDIPYAYEARLRHADGSYRWVSVVGRVLARDQNGKPSRLLGVRIDITARKRAEEERLQGLERITDAFVALDKNWRYTYVNKKAGQMFDREPGQLVGRHIWTEFPEGIGQKFYLAYEKAMADQQPSYIEEYYPPYQRWFENYLYPSPDGLSIYFHDITARKLAELAVIQREQRLRDLINGLGPAILVGLTTPEGILLEVNEPALATAGLKLEDVIGKSLEDTFWVNYADESKNQIRDAVKRGAQGESSRFDMQIRGEASQAIFIDFSMQPIYDESGQVAFLVPSASVITERKLAEDALRNSEERYRLLVDLSPYAICVNQDGYIVLANRAALTMFGSTRPADLVGQPILDLIHPDHWDAVQDRVRRMLAGESGLYPAEARYLKRDGSAFDVEVSAAPFTFKGRPAVQVIALDISKRKQAEVALRENRLQLKSISRRVLEVQEAERRRIAVELHDELGQALAAIKINLLARNRFRGQSPEDLNRENLRIVEDALQQVRRMALTLRPSVLDDLGLAPALRWLVEQSSEHNGFGADFRAASPQGRLTPEMETTYFRIAQAALTNVVRHARAQHVTLELFQDGGTLVLTVHDDGCGFDVVAMQKRARAGGSIGLLGMQERATLIGGHLDIESTPGQGTTLRLVCPLRMLGEAV